VSPEGFGEGEGPQYESLQVELTATWRGRPWRHKAKAAAMIGIRDRAIENAQKPAGLRIVCAEMIPHFGMPHICPGLIRI
jgi:hypothetical protein